MKLKSFFIGFLLVTLSCDSKDITKSEMVLDQTNLHKTTSTVSYTMTTQIEDIEPYEPYSQPQVYEGSLSADDLENQSYTIVYNVVESQSNGKPTITMTLPQPVTGAANDLLSYSHIAQIIFDGTAVTAKDFNGNLIPFSGTVTLDVDAFNRQSVLMKGNTSLNYIEKATKQGHKVSKVDENHYKIISEKEGEWRERVFDTNFNLVISERVFRDGMIVSEKEHTFKDLSGKKLRTNSKHKKHVKLSSGKIRTRTITTELSDIKFD